MRIAGISMTYNDGYKIKEWYEHYCEYKNDLEIFVIVDNGSDPEYLEELHNTFGDAIIIERKSNGGCTAAYNDGIKYVLENTDIEAIMIIANDMKVSKSCLPSLYEYLYGDEKLGIVSTAILYKNTDIVDNYGHFVDKINMICCNQGDRLSELSEKRKYTDLVSGGFTMAKREFYLKAGLQDESLFMYGDEIDTTYKARNAGFKIGVISEVYAWHWHINKEGDRRFPASTYLINRNRIYLAKKYIGLRYANIQLINRILMNAGRFVYYSMNRNKCKYRRMPLYGIVGSIHGYIGKMNTNKFTIFK